jgi:hypothetical protein
MPKWTVEDEEKLCRLILEGEALEDIAILLKRSPDAVLMKVKRLGLPAPKRKSVRRNGANKVTIAATTTTQAEPLTPAKELISIQEALQIMLSGLKRLMDPNVSPSEVKRIRLLITGLKSYVVIQQEYYVRMRTIEKGLITTMQKQIVHFQALMEQAKSEEEKAFWKKQIEELEKAISELESKGETKAPAEASMQG